MMNAQTKIRRAQNPDKAGFMLFLGVGLLIFVFPLAYWAYYNYGHYQSSARAAQDLREQSTALLTPGERAEREHNIFYTDSMTDRYRLEMFLSSAGGFVVLVIASICLRSALKSRGQKPIYADVDWRNFPAPTGRVEVRFTRFQNFLLIGVIIFFALASLFNISQLFRSQFTTSNGFIIKGVLFPGVFFVLILVFIFLMIRAKRKSVRVLDAFGVTRGDGRIFSWEEFQGVVTKTAVNRYGSRYVWRIELAFANDEQAWIIPQRIKNFQEIYAFVDALPPAVLKDVK